MGRVLPVEAGTNAPVTMRVCVCRLRRGDGVGNIHTYTSCVSYSYKQTHVCHSTSRRIEVCGGRVKAGCQSAGLMLLHNSELSCRDSSETQCALCSPPAYCTLTKLQRQNTNRESLARARTVKTTTLIVSANGFNTKSKPLSRLFIVRCPLYF